MKKLCAILFDMDGTVLDTLSDLTDSVNVMLRSRGLPERSQAEVAARLGSGARELVRCVLPAGCSDETVTAALTEYKAYYEAHCAVKTRPYDGILPLMRRLRASGIRTAIVSNKPDGAVQRLCAEHFAGLSDCSIGESAAHRRKPAPDMVLAALERLGVRADEAIYVGDTEVDIQTGKNAGVKVLSVSWGFRTREELLAAKASVIVDTVKQAGDYLLQQ